MQAVGQQQDRTLVRPGRTQGQQRVTHPGAVVPGAGEPEDPAPVLRLRTDGAAASGQNADGEVPRHRLTWLATRLLAVIALLGRTAALLDVGALVHARHGAARTTVAPPPDLSRGSSG